MSMNCKMSSQRHPVLHTHYHRNSENVCGKIKWKKNGLWYQSNRLISFQIMCANFLGNERLSKQLMFEYTTLAWSNT